MANAQTAIFKFESVNPIRSIIIDGQPWFVAQDVCSALRIQNVTQALEKLDDDERSMFNIGHEHRAIFDSRVKEINIISESGLYTLILRCRDAVTPGTIPYRFRKWVTGEVLPQIRRTGSYIKKLAHAGRTHKDGCRPGSQRHGVSSNAGDEDREQNLQCPTEARLP